MAKPAAKATDVKKTATKHVANTSDNAKIGETFAPSPHDAMHDRREFGSALGRAIEMLETVLEADGALGIQEICTRLDLPRQSAHRILNQLLDLKLLQRHAACEQYTIGPRLRNLSLKAAYRSHTTGPWHSVLQNLAARTKETCHVGILDQNKVLLIDRIESEYALRVISEIGRRLDPHSSSIGKLLLAHLPKRRREILLMQSQPLTKYTTFTLTDIDELEAEFTKIRRYGYSYSNQGTMLGILSLAAPIKDAQGRVMAGVGYQAPLVRMSLERAIDEIAPILVECANRMSEILIQDEAEFKDSWAAGLSSEDSADR